MRAPTTRVSRTVMLASTPVAVLLAGLMVWQGTNAAFTANTRSIGNSWETGAVSISDNDNGSAMFNVQNVVPGQVGSNCIVVTATPTVSSTVKTYVESMAPNGLENYLYTQIEQGTGGTFGDCSGFTANGPSSGYMTLATAAAHFGSYANGVLPWVVAPGTSSATYKVSWRFDTGALDQAGINALQGKGVSFNIQWELQNN